MFKSLIQALIISISLSHFAQALEVSDVVKGYRSADGHVLVEMNSSQYPSGNVFFLGDAKRLNQLELTWDDANRDERVVTYIATEGGDSSEMTFSSNSASVENGLRLGQPHVDKMSAMSAGELKAIAKASLQILPTIWKSKYLFQSAKSGEYILVKEPVFNFHGNYRVMIGDLNGLKEISVKTSENWKQGVAGNIAFTSGGGLFIPKMGEILSTLKPSQAEMPTLVRSDSAVFETLKVPKLSPVQLARLGFVRERSDVLSAHR